MSPSGFVGTGTFLPYHIVASVLSPSLGEAQSLGSGFLPQTGGCLLLFSICSWQRESVQLPLQQLTAG